MKNKPVAFWNKYFELLEKNAIKNNDAENEWIKLYAQQRPHNTVLVPCDKLAEMQAEIEGYHQQALKDSRWVSQLSKDVTTLEKTVEQQQAEIEALKEKAKKKVIMNEDYGSVLHQQQAEIEALKEKLSLWEEFGRQVVGCKPNNHSTS